jgi:hypothetical protein
MMLINCTLSQVYPYGSKCTGYLSDVKKKVKVCVFFTCMDFNVYICSIILKTTFI